jgi:hypothetical protein
MRFEQMNASVSANISIQDVFVTQFFSDMLLMMQSSIDISEENI